MTAPPGSPLPPDMDITPKPQGGYTVVISDVFLTRMAEAWADAASIVETGLVRDDPAHSGQVPPAPPATP